MGLFNTSLGFEKVNSTKVSKQKIIFGLVLPTPLSRASYTNILCEDPQFQHLCIEHYFSDRVLKDAGVFGQEIDGKIKLINKNNFASKIISNLDPVEFENFKMIFDEIKLILSE